MIEKSVKTILTVSDLNAEVNLHLSQNFGLLWIEGEISNFSQPASGHMYFTLKDEKAQIRCALFKNRNRYLKKRPKNGDLVHIRGRIGLYEPRGDYQLIAEHLEDAGIGVLQKRFEALKQKLAIEGLFDDEAKHVFPEQPRHIGIITSPTGAAIRDILQVLKRRAPHVPVTIYPSAVQGDAATDELIKALRTANQQPIQQRCDVLILARGGGSIEDLWPFNHETLAHAIYESEIPVISGIGHEIDFTIADFVADLRAPTPSAAAELISPDIEQLQEYIEQTEYWLVQTLLEQIQYHGDRLDWLNQRLTQLQPEKQIQQQQQRTDELLQRLHYATRAFISHKRYQFKHINAQHQHQSPLHFINEQQQNLDHLAHTLSQAMQLIQNNKYLDFTALISKLDGISPLKTLERGYSITQTTDNKVITSVSQVKAGDEIKNKVADGEITSKVV